MTTQKPSGSGIGARLRDIPIRIWLALVLLVLAVVFIVQNTAQASVRLIFFTLTMPIWIYTAAMLAIGLVIGLLLHRRSDQPGNRKATRKEKRAARKAGTTPAGPGGAHRTPAPSSSTASPSAAEPTIPRQAGSSTDTPTSPGTPGASGTPGS